TTGYHRARLGDAAAVVGPGRLRRLADQGGRRPPGLPRPQPGFRGRGERRRAPAGLLPARDCGRPGGRTLRGLCRSGAGLVLAPPARRVCAVSGGRRLRAPLAHGAVVSDPPLRELARRLAGVRWDPTVPPDLRLCGRPLVDLRRLGRASALQAAHAYLDPTPFVRPAPDAAILAAGHQPEIFHPGVWVKNFALHGLARAVGATPLNLVVDNDTVKTTSLAVPCWAAGRREDPHAYRIEKVPFDHWH